MWREMSVEDYLAGFDDVEAFIAVWRACAEIPEADRAVAVARGEELCVTWVPGEAFGGARLAPEDVCDFGSRDI